MHVIQLIPSLERRVCSYRGAPALMGKSRTCPGPNTKSSSFVPQPNLPFVTTTLTDPALATQFLLLSLHLFTVRNLQTFNLLFPSPLGKMRVASLALVALLPLVFAQSTTSTVTVPSAPMVTDDPPAAHYIATFTHGSGQSIVGLCAAETPTNTTTGTLFTLNINGAPHSGGPFCKSFRTA